MRIVDPAGPLRSVSIDGGLGLGFADAAFDVMTCRFAFHHLEDPRGEAQVEAFMRQLRTQRR
jgi:hypothetical protein